jgi:hypothetical protein
MLIRRMRREGRSSHEIRHLQTKRDKLVLDLEMSSSQPGNIDKSKLAHEISAIKVELNRLTATRSTNARGSYPDRKLELELALFDKLFHVQLPEEGYPEAEFNARKNKFLAEKLRELPKLTSVERAKLAQLEKRQNVLDQRVKVEDKKGVAYVKTLYEALAEAYSKDDGNRVNVLKGQIEDAEEMVKVVAPDGTMQFPFNAHDEKDEDAYLLALEGLYKSFTESADREMAERVAAVRAQALGSLHKNIALRNFAKMLKGRDETLEAAVLTHLLKTKREIPAQLGVDIFRKMKESDNEAYVEVVARGLKEGLLDWTDKALWEPLRSWGAPRDKEKLQSLYEKLMPGNGEARTALIEFARVKPPPELKEKDARVVAAIAKDDKLNVEEKWSLMLKSGISSEKKKEQLLDASDVRRYVVKKILEKDEDVWHDFILKKEGDAYPFVELPFQMVVSKDDLHKLAQVYDRREILRLFLKGEWHDRDLKNVNLFRKSMAEANADEIVDALQHSPFQAQLQRLMTVIYASVNRENERDAYQKTKDVISKLLSESTKSPTAFLLRLFGDEMDPNLFDNGKFVNIPFELVLEGNKENPFKTEVKDRQDRDKVVAHIKKHLNLYVKAVLEGNLKVDHLVKVLIYKDFAVGDTSFFEVVSPPRLNALYCNVKSNNPKKRATAQTLINHVETLFSDSGVGIYNIPTPYTPNMLGVLQYRRVQCDHEKEDFSTLQWQTKKAVDFLKEKAEKGLGWLRGSDAAKKATPLDRFYSLES